MNPPVSPRSAAAAAPLEAVADGDAASEPPQRFEIDVLIEDQGWRVLGNLEALITATASALADELGDRMPGNASATICLDDDNAVRALNRQFRGQDKPTNVLSFPAASKLDRSMGDIILARETVLREADEMTIAPDHHLMHLTIHGLLHLLGYGHETDAQATIMETIETAALARLAISDPYAERT
jgi:probable rRNA maturation factor